MYFQLTFFSQKFVKALYSWLRGELNMRSCGCKSGMLSTELRDILQNLIYNIGTYSTPKSQYIHSGEGREVRKSQ